MRDLLENTAPARRGGAALISIAITSCLLALSQTAARAQTTGDGAEPAGEAVPPPPQVTCTPSCRSGYLCMQGRCVSQCNPPCGAGERCEAGECLAMRRPAPGELDWSAAPLPRAGAETHDGFMLRLSIGLGYGVVSESTNGAGTFKLSGVAGSFAVDLGAAVTENAVIHARISDMLLFDPRVSVNGNDQGQAQNVSVGGVFFGPAFTYYFMPINFYVTGALGMSWIRASNADQNTSYTSDLGLGLNVDVGKEWWVSDNWGLGIAARFWYTHAADKEAGLDVSFDMSGFALLFSATYQ